VEEERDSVDGGMTPLCVCERQRERERERGRGREGDKENGGEETVKDTEEESTLPW
jgi:hypothetical protein